MLRWSDPDVVAIVKGNGGVLERSVKQVRWMGRIESPALSGANWAQSNRLLHVLCLRLVRFFFPLPRAEVFGNRPWLSGWHLCDRYVAERHLC